MHRQSTHSGIPDIVLVVVGVSMGAFGVAVLYFNLCGDLGTSCRDAAEIAVAGQETIYCSIPSARVVRVVSAAGKHVMDIPIEANQGGFSMGLTASGELHVSVFRGRSVQRFSLQGQPLGKCSDATLCVYDLSRYPQRRVRIDKDVEYELTDDQVYEVRSGSRRLIVRSRTPAPIPRGAWVGILVLLAAAGALVAAKYASDVPQLRGHLVEIARRVLRGPSRP